MKTYGSCQGYAYYIIFYKSKYQKLKSPPAKANWRAGKMMPNVVTSEEKLRHPEDYANIETSIGTIQSSKCFKHFGF
jgi:hypothetical protein